MSNTKNIGTIGKLIITDRLQKIIDSLHNKVGATEWSGILFYKLTKGNIKNLKNLEFTADFLYPMNIGSHAYTEFDYSGEIMNAYDLYEEGLESSTAMVHSHHTMSAFFSGTDTSELLDNAKNFNYYLSLIVNFAKEPVCKIAFPSKGSNTIETFIKGSNGELIKVKSVEDAELIIIGDLDVILPEEIKVEDWVIDRVKALKEAKIKIETPKITYPAFNSAKWGARDDWDLESSYMPQGRYTPQKGNVKDFLIALITLDVNNKVTSVKGAIDEITNDKTFNPDIYEEAVEINLETIHQDEFGESDNIVKHCLQALIELYELEAEYADNEVFDIIRQNLIAYAG